MIFTFKQICLGSEGQITNSSMGFIVVAYMKQEYGLKHDPDELTIAGFMNGHLDYAVETGKFVPA